jgi:hypothetical protein
MKVTVFEVHETTSNHVKAFNDEFVTILISGQYLAEESQKAFDSLEYVFLITPIMNIRRKSLLLSANNTKTLSRMRNLLGVV